MPRLRDQAVLLEPDVTVDELTENSDPDWAKAPASATPTRFQGHPLDSSEEQLTADTIIARWRGYLPATWEGILTSAFRIRWHGEDYTIDGAVDVHRRAGRARYLGVTLKKVSGETVSS